MPQTPIHGLPYPVDTDPAAVPADFEALATRLDAVLPAAPVPAPVDGQWLKGAGGAMVWAAIKSVDVPGTARVVGQVRGDGTTGDAGFTVARLGTGNYRVTLPVTIYPMVPMVSLVASSLVGCAQVETGTSFIVYITTPSAYADGGFYFAVFDYSARPTELPAIPPEVEHA